MRKDAQRIFLTAGAVTALILCPATLCPTLHAQSSTAIPAATRLYKDFVDEGYIFVFQDIRGRYKSEGQFVMFRPPRDKSDAA